MAADEKTLSPGVTGDGPDPDGVQRRPIDVIDVLWSMAEGGQQPYPPTEAELAATREWLEAREWNHEIPPGLYE